MRLEPSFRIGGKPAFGEQFLDERTRLRHITGQRAQFCDCVLLTFQNESRPSHMQVKSVAGNQSKRQPNFRWNHHTALPTHHKCGIHWTSVPHVPSWWQMRSRQFVGEQLLMGRHTGLVMPADHAAAQVPWRDWPFHA
jgi:hypothetical protein